MGHHGFCHWTDRSLMTIHTKRTHLLFIALLLCGQLLLSFHHHDQLQQSSDCQICLQAQDHFALPPAVHAMEVDYRPFLWLNLALSHSHIPPFESLHRARAPPSLLRLI